MRFSNWSEDSMVKLKYKLFGLIFALIMVMSLTNYQLLTQSFQVIQIKRLESAEALLGKSLAQKIYRLVIEGQKEAVVATLFREKDLRETKLKYLVVNNRKGELFAHTYLTELPLDIYSLRNDFTSNQEYRIEDLLAARLGVYNIGVPIREGIIQVGTLHVGIDAEFISDAASPMKRASTKTLLFGLVIVMVGGILAFLASFAITSSLTKLEVWAARLSKGEYDADIDIRSNDEIGRLARSFLKMRDNIQQAHGQLELQNLNLEETVQLRTRELEQNYVQLKKLHVDLEEQRKNLKIVFSAMNYPLFVVNLDYTIVMMNDETKRRIDTGDPGPYKCHVLSHGSAEPCDSKDHQCPLPLVVETKKPVFLEHDHITENGEVVTVEVRAFPIFDEEGNVVQVVESCIDISEKKKAEEEKLRLERELSKAHKLEAIGTLAAGVAHEINTPIQFIGDNTLFSEEAAANLFEIIASYRQLIEKISEGSGEDVSEALAQIDEDGDLEYLRDELPKALTQTKDGVDHVANIVKAMKDFSHTSSSDEMQPEDLNRAIETTLIISRNEWKYVADMELDLDSDLPLVMCRIGEIKQVLLNLIINAAHTIGEKVADTNDKGVIKVTSSIEETSVKVSVGDSGMGIAEVHKERIFDPFYTTKEVRKGTGQGLSVAYQIVVDKHGGKLWFDTVPGEGSTFHLLLHIDNATHTSQTT